jgi:hypothetical protein
MVDNGMVRSRVPLSEIYTKNQQMIFHLILNNYGIVLVKMYLLIEYDFLAFHRAQIVLRDGTKVWGTYIFTVDWFNNPYSDEPTDYKCGHIFESDEGYLMCMPNNRIFWKDSNWVTKSLPKDLKQYKVDTELPSVENQSDRWVTEDGDSFYYDINETIH